MAQTELLGPGNELGITKDDLYGLHRPTGTNVTNTGVPTLDATAAAAGVSLKVYGGSNILGVHLTLTSVAVTITDAGASGASGTMKLLDFPQGFGLRDNFRMSLDSISLSAGGDSGVTDIGVGSTATAAAESLATTTQDIVLKDDITLSSGAAASQVITGTTKSAVLGTASTQVAAHLNIAGTAATYSANGVMTFNGDIFFQWVNLSN